MCEYFSVIRKLKHKDAKRMVEMMRDVETVKYLQIGGNDYTFEQAENFITYAQSTEKDFHFAVADDQDVYQGTISLKNVDYVKSEAEYAIAMHPEAQGKGFAAKATKDILDFAFKQLELDRIYLNVLSENIRANKFYKKAGFKLNCSNFCVFKEERKQFNWYEVRR